MFGDLVTCESWANLHSMKVLQIMLEYLWQEYKYDSDGRYSRLSESSGYFDQAAYDAFIDRYH